MNLRQDIAPSKRQAQALTTGLLWVGLCAAQPGPPEPSSTQLDEINVTTRRDLEMRFNSTSTRVTIGRRDIEAMGANTIGDILRQAPGMQVSTTANGGIEIRMRGMAAENTRILIDGVPVSANNRSTQLPLDELPADLIERIEVIRAPTAEFQGAAGGTLNIVLRAASAKRETYIWLSDQYVWGRHAGLAFFSQTGPLGAPRLGKPKDADLQASAWTYFVSLTAGNRSLGNDTAKQSFNTAGNQSTLSIADQLRIHNTFWTLTPRVNGRLGSSDRLTVRGQLSVTDQRGLVNSTGLSTLGTQEFLRENTNPWTYQRPFYQLGIDWSHSFKDAKWDSTVQIERSGHETHTRNTGTSTAAAAPGIQSTSFATFDDQRRERGFFLNSKWMRSLGDQMFTVGGEYDRRSIDIDTAALFESNGTVVSQTALAFQASTLRSALWTQYEIPFEASKATVVFGLRAQDYRIDAQTAGNPLAYQNLFWQPTINVRKALDDTTQLRWNLARITRTPNVWELSNTRTINLITNSPSSADFQGNSALRPQVTAAMDMGIDRRLKNGGQFGINVFVRHQQDVIARTVTQQAGRWVEQPSNVGDAVVWGLESDFRMPAKWAGLAADWTVSGNASLLQSRMNNGLAEGQRIPGQARYLVNLNLAKPLRTSGGWYGGGTLSLVGAFDLNTDNPPGASATGQEKAHTQIDLYIGSVLSSLGFWRLNVYNLSNFSQQRNRIITDSNGVVFGENYQRTLTPRWFLTVGTRF
jgi:outer membrane receptor for ferrienterochelin and colicins